MSFTCSGLGPVILWEGVLLSPEGKGGGGGGGASPPRDVLWLGEMSVGRGSKGKAAVEGGGPCSVRATYVPAEKRLKMESIKMWRKTKTGRFYSNYTKQLLIQTHIWWALPPPDGTWRTPASRSPERQKDRRARLKTGNEQWLSNSVWQKVIQTFMIRSPSWTPAFTAAPPVKMKTGILKCASANNVFTFKQLIL